MHLAEDVFENTSVELSAVIAAVLDDEDVRQPANLAELREAVLSEVRTATIPLNRFSSERREQLRSEIDSLIDAYGEDALAVRFMRPWASEPLQRLIEAELEEIETPTLGHLFEAAEAGLLAALIGRGEIDDDEAQSVLAELEQLIARHGEGAIAEAFLGGH